MTIQYHIVYIFIIIKIFLLLLVSESQLPTLIVCPASVIDKVSKVFENSNQSLKIYNHRGKSKKSWISPQYIENYNIILTTYHYLAIQECLPLSEEELKKRRSNKCMIQKPIIQKNTTPVSCLHLVLWNRVIIIDADLLLHKEKKKFNCVNQLYANHMIFICKNETNDDELLQLISSKSNINERINRIKDYLISF